MAIRIKRAQSAWTQLEAFAASNLDNDIDLATIIIVVAVVVVVVVVIIPLRAH